jgi:putative transposase
VEDKKMSQKRRHYSAEFKFRVALEAIKGQKTINEIASKHNIHPTMVRNWKKQLQEEGREIFQRGGKSKRTDQAKQEAALYEQIGRLKMELEWLKKKAAQFD